MQKLVLASSNKGKIAEFRQIFKGYEIVPMEELGFDGDIVEDGKTFFENALIKAKTVSKFLKEKNLEYPVIGDDSGLCVNALNGAPGIYSARYAGDHDIKANRKKLLEDLKDKDDRTAYFNCTLVMYMPNDDCIFAEGKTCGKITNEELGESGFAYDCLFMSDDLGKTFGQATSAEKNKVSHRSRAIKSLLGEYKKYCKTHKVEVKENQEVSQEKAPITKKHEFWRAFKFLLFSISAGVIQMGTFTLLNELVKWSYWPSYLISLTLSVLWNFTLNREFTFKSANNVPIAMLKVLAFYAVFTPLSTWWGQALSGVMNEYIILALTMIINFVGEFLYCRFFVYGKSLDTNGRAKGEK